MKHGPIKFCSRCGSDQLQRLIPEGDHRIRVVCANCRTIHYQNPRIIAGCLPVWKDKVLLCRRAIEPRRGFWNIPAGFLENGEAIEAGAAREVWEEAAAKVKIERVLAVFTLLDFHHVYVHFTGELVDGAFGVGEESLETRLFSEEEIPWEDIAFISSKFALEAFFEDRRLGLERTHVGSR